MDPPSADDYELLDFGDGAKLERFGPFTIQRPCPAAQRCAPRCRRAWQQVSARFDGRDTRSARWTLSANMPETWSVQLDGLTLMLRRTPTGQLGLFPEQRANWGWLARQVRRARRPLRMLNLFAYTGASTLAAAAAGAQVTHLDAAKSAVSWAQRNARVSEIPNDRVRWVVDDARKFVQRLIRRDEHFDAIVIDPPSYGHGPRREPWKIQQHLPELLGDCRRLLTETPAFVLVTCHSPAFGKSELQAAVDTFLCQSCASGSRARDLSLKTRHGRTLPSGTAVHWPGDLP